MLILFLSLFYSEKNILLLLLYPKHVVKPLGYNLGCYRSGPYILITSTLFRAVTLNNESGNEFKVNGQRLKHYIGGSINEVDPDFKKEKEFYLKEDNLQQLSGFRTLN